MNEEMMKIRENENLSIDVEKEIKRIDKDIMKEYLFNLNTNMSNVYTLQNSNKITIDDYINCFIKNIYIVLDMFSKMDVYPNYFYNVIFKINSKYHEMAKIYGNSKLVNEADSSPEIPRMIRDGLSKGYNSYHASEIGDINDSFLEMVSFHQAYNLSYNNNTIEQCKKSFTVHANNIANIMNDFYVSDYDFEDIEYMAKLLFEYISFFVEIGVNPKELLNEYIDSIKEEKTK